MDRKFLVAHHDEKVREKILEGILKVDGPMAQTIVAVDGAEAAFKIGNAVHHVAFIGADLPKRSGTQLAEWIFSEKTLEPLSVILLQPFPEDDYLIEHVVSGRLQFLTDPEDFEALEKCLMRALDYYFHGDKEEFHLRFFAPRDVVMKEGERGDKCYLLVKGRLRTVRMVDGAEIFLGHVEKGEFVGEMAYINGEPRSADVIVEEATEAIEIPYNRLDIVLFRKPAWARALMRTLSRRLKLANEATKYNE